MGVRIFVGVSVLAIVGFSWHESSWRAEEAKWRSREVYLQNNLENLARDFRASQDVLSIIIEREREQFKEIPIVHIPAPAIPREVALVNQIRAKLFVGMRRQDAVKVVFDLTNKTRCDRIDIYGTNERIPEFNYVERLLPIADVTRFFPTASGYRLNLLFSDTLEDWYVRIN